MHYFVLGQPTATINPKIKYPKSGFKALFVSHANPLVTEFSKPLKDAIDRTEALATKTVERLDGIDARVEFLEQIHRKQAEVDKVLAENAAKLDAIRPTLHLPPTTPPQED